MWLVEGIGEINDYSTLITVLMMGINGVLMLLLMLLMMISECCINPSLKSRERREGRPDEVDLLLIGD
jgi:hypothetical protein